MPTLGPSADGSLAMCDGVMPMLHLPGVMMPGQFGPEQAGAREVADERVVDERLVLGRDALGDAHDEPDAGLGRLEDRGGRRLGRDGDERRRGPGGLDGVGDGVEHRDALDVLAALAGRHAADDLGAVVAVAQAVELALAAGEALDDDLGVGVDEDRHLRLPLLNRRRSGPLRGRPRASSAC